ncbi:cysteine--tRNA ligase [Brevundimonas aveniformis]|uniref:cysteine--tRNA ligase n=1 Tax=Brevundimonas aveniformis TaxID=370977 RepID=UPI0003FF5DAF|nr:cysteine--tRNA ligase [Brevundimonas aveniformis]
MPLKLHDTLSREKRVFEPAQAERVTMYVCGPTVYNHAHIGNARPAVVFDVLFRLLQRLYPEREVVYARNITDVDDKINQKAAEEGVEIGVITERYTDIYHGDLDALGCLRPTVEPRATAHMAEMIALIEAMLADGTAYVADGEVLFDVEGYDAGTGRYGALSNRSLSDMVAGARVEVAQNKRHAADFVLWKPSKPAEPAWDGPHDPTTGQPLPGRPGWHIECSAMSEKVLGLPFDIHGGGLDLIFPHHTNEIAQSCAAHGLATNTDFARYWMHNGFLTMDAEKMSKSLGNVSLITELLERQPGEVLRWALLSAHYRGPLDWTDQLVDQARKNLDRLYGALKRARAAGGISDSAPPQLLLDALSDDLNSPAAMAVLFDAAGAVERALNDGEVETAAARAGELLAGGALMGLLQQDPDAWFEGGADDGFKAQVEALLEARAAARAAKDWGEADRIRGELAALNVVVMDGPTGATWRRG